MDAKRTMDFLYVVFGEFALSLADQIDDSLMCIDILPRTALPWQQ
jgi:hypothetical protein